MAVEWYLQDLRGQYGPLGTAELRKKLRNYKNLENVLIWREGFQNWKQVPEVFDSFDTSGTLNQRRRVKGRWALYGLTVGVLIFAADIAFEWRGKQFLPWNGNEAENIGRIIGSAGILTLLFFLAGAMKEALFSRSKIPSSVESTAVETPQQITPGKRSAHKYNNFVAKNWRGEYPLPISYWVFGLIGNFAIALIPLGLSAVYETKSGFQPTHVFAFILGVWLISIAISVWQWVSVWRSANRDIERKSRRLRARALGRCRKALSGGCFLSTCSCHRYVRNSAGDGSVTRGVYGRS
jgi:hypothetical protein